MMAYYNGEDGLEIIAPASKGDFVIKQTMISEIGSGNLSGKMYKGAIPGWGNLTGPEAIEHMITKAGEVEGGFEEELVEAGVSVATCPQPSDI